MDKLEAVQRILRFSNTIRDWCETKHKVYFDDFDSENVNDYEPGGYGDLSDAIIEDGLAENIIEEDDLENQ
ncbi:MAG: hypothetical protein GWM98_28550 [Nitrospinaceae bacterium]|nr:hypothetical protein [Nitrospinaceae bacterium]NIR57681.1 hypothetical protein [Nitrospinaceae bacterium]NIT85023.1 hypothetical protein [Nitrospinaceae bacterium]NIW08745.1 hypothetical protein [Nitrospinaceae bacterium]NIX37336.1 hypothetical protein [Nitrospinaceae bacterium]